jgi:hypothetical protein
MQLQPFPLQVANFQSGPVPNENSITQAQLARLKLLRELIREYDTLRNLLTALMEQNARVEEGPISVRLQVSESHRMTHAKLVKICGEEYANWVYQQIEPTKSRVLKLDLVNCDFRTRNSYSSSAQFTDSQKF